MDLVESRVLSEVIILENSFISLHLHQQPSDFRFGEYHAFRLCRSIHVETLSRRNCDGSDVMIDPLAFLTFPKFQFESFETPLDIEFAAW